MRSKRIILLESNTAIVEQLKDALQKSEEFNLVFVSDDGDEGIKHLICEKPDLIITGMFLKGTDGFGVIQAAKKSWPTVKILAMGMANDGLIERALNEGADFYLVKPFGVDVAIERMNDLLQQSAEREVKNYANPHRKAVTVEEKISEIFISIGIPPHIKGYAYLRDAIKMTVEKPYVINSVTKELYPSVARLHETSASKVERAIRHAIEVAWNRGRIDAINAIFGTRVYLGSEKPTNSEFIALVADKLILESMM